MAAHALDPTLRPLVSALARAGRLYEARRIVRGRDEASDETVVDLASPGRGVFRNDPAVREAAQALADSRGIVRCQCGETGGDRCPWVGPKTDTVRVRWVDPSLRGTAEAAESWRGVSEVLQVAPECADLILADEGEWAEVVS